MFHEEFYPTPPGIIWKMISGYDLCKRAILEPNAGKGDILDYIKKQSRYSEHSSSYGSDLNLSCIEINPELQHILRGKGYELIAEDFLEYQDDRYFDLIVMNPPFSNAQKHILKAWSVIEEGDVVTLMPKAMYENYEANKGRKLLRQLIDTYATEVTDLGNCFSMAERKTNVEVLLVRIRKAENKNSRFNFNAISQEDSKNVDFDENSIGNSLMRANFIEATVDSYNMAKDAAIDAVKAIERFQRYSIFFASKQSVSDILFSNRHPRLKYDELSDVLRTGAWNYVFDKSKIRNVLTSSVRDDFNKHSKQYGPMQFTIANIENMFSMLVLNSGKIMHDCVVEIFDKMCSYDEKNKVHWEGWKTNSAYKVNRKVIMPWMIQYDFGRFKFHYSRDYNRLRDIDMVMCLLSGIKIEDLDDKANSSVESTETTLYKAFDLANSTGENYCVGTFFNMRFFKKGTLHLEFRDPDLWMKFNIAAAAGKKWLPADT